MKKLATLLLAVTMVLSLCACADSGAKQEGLQVGFGRENITPDFSCGLGGYSDQATRRSEGELDYIYITCIAMTEGDETILLYTMDNQGANQDTVDAVRAEVSPATGVPNDHIYVLATHSHSTPSLGHDDTQAQMYRELVYESAVKAGQAALEDRSAATVYTAKPEIEGMNFVRHYEMADGTYAGSNFGDFNKTIVGHATKTDPQMPMVKFDRADESKQDILMLSWQAHPDHSKSIGYTYISADYPGAIRAKVEKETDLLCAFFTGASGNQNPDSLIQEEMHYLSMKEYGEKLAEHAIAALPTMTEATGTGIKTTQLLYEAEIDHSWDHMLEQAKEVWKIWYSQGDKAAGTALAKSYGFSSAYQARTIRGRADMPATGTLELNAFSVHGVGFITGTYEMFSDAGLYIKGNSPFDTTMVLVGNSGYIPSAEAYDYRSYEADTGMYAKGTAEKLAEKYVELLNFLK